MKIWDIFLGRIDKPTTDDKDKMAINQSL